MNQGASWGRIRYADALIRSHRQPCFSPYPMVDFGFDELIIKVSAASPLTQNQKQHDIETVFAANYLLGKKPITTI